MSSIVFRGNIANPPEYREKDGKEYLRFRVLENRRKSDGNGGYIDDEPNAFNALVTGKRASMFKETLKQGMPVLIAGSVAPNNHDQPASEDRPATNWRGFTVFVDDLGVVPYNCTIQFHPKSQRDDYQQDPLGTGNEPQF